MARELEDKKFTNGSDADVGASLYKEGFVRAFDTLRQQGGFSVFYYELGWGTAEVPTLVAGIEYAEAHCRPKDKEGKEEVELWLNLTNNKFTDAEKARLRAAVPEGSTKFGVNV